MKKSLAVVGVLLILLLFSLVGFTKEYPEGMKKVTAKSDSSFSITVPEKCPEFLDWPARVLGAKKFANGHVMALIESQNADETVFVAALWAIIDDQPHCLSLQVAYFPQGGFKKGVPVEDQIKMDYIEDVQFMQTFKTSDRLTRVKVLTDWKAIQPFFERILI